MRSVKNHILMLTAVSALGWTPSLSAGELYPFTYIDHGSTISISKCSNSATGIVSVPALIDGKPVTEIDSYAFGSSSFYTEVVLPSSVTKIAPYAFSFCRLLQRFSSLGGLVSIDSDAFYFCDRLTSVILPASVTTIGDGAFTACQRLSDIALPAGLTSLGKFALAGTSITEVEIPSGLTVISDYAFGGCRSLKSVVIPPNVVSIGEGAFSASGLTELTISPSVISIGNAAFERTFLTSVVIPSTVKNFGNAVFRKCRFMKEITLPSNMSSIGDEMFSECESLRQVTIPASATSIGKSAFALSGLTSIRISSKVKTIGESAFQDCTGLSTVTIPTSVSDIGLNAFYGCTRMVSASFLGDAPLMQQQVFGLAAVGFKIFFSKSSKGFTVPRWHGYQTSRPAPEIVVQVDKLLSLKDGEDEAVFGNVIVGKKSSTRTYFIRNVGTKKLTGLSVITREGDFADFVPKNLTKSSLAPGKSASFQLVFKPKARGRRETTVEILSSDANENPFDFKLTGKGLVLIH
ncbi:MAG: leucine-rich repeat protein [Armatimonadetes bacterium]|nr:leucine-rich repeat protein [Akkermansiaceae bacterium]